VLDLDADYVVLGAGAHIRDESHYYRKVLDDVITTTIKLNKQRKKPLTVFWKTQNPGGCSREETAAAAAADVSEETTRADRGADNECRGLPAYDTPAYNYDTFLERDR
jgi:hypothetical protein